MTQLTPIQMDDGTVLYIEATEDANTVSAIGIVVEEEEALTERGFGTDARQKLVIQSFQAIEGTIRAYTTYTLNAFKQMAIANVDKVTLEFGIKVGAEACVPYITKGTAESNLKITVECSFPKSVNT
jgi:Trypsin-co-occurring domain 1